MNLPQNILHIISDLDGYGLSRQLELLIARQRNAGQHARVVALQGQRPLVKAWRQQGIEVRTLDQRWLRDPFAAVRLISELRRPNFELLHLWGQASVDYVGAVSPFVPQTPRLASLSDFNTPIAIEPPQQNSLSRSQFLTAQALPDQSKLIAVAGPLVRSQNIDEAIWHFELVRTLDEDVRLLIFGDGPERHRLERFTRLTSDPAAVRFLGYRRDFRELLPHLDLFWHTATGSSARPYTLLEAMAAGVPVVANDTANCRSVIEHGENGYLVPNNDRAIFARHTRSLLLDEQHAQAVAESAQAITERYSPDAMAAAYADMYQCQSA